MPADNPPRWITVTGKFDYRWPGRSAITHYRADAGEQLVKGEVADYAVAKGYATEGKADGSEARSTKGKKRTRRRKAAKPEADATATDTAADDGLAGSGVAADDSAEVRDPVDQAAGER